MSRMPAALCVALLVAGCDAPAPAPETTTTAKTHDDDDTVALTREQIAAAGIALARPTPGGAAAAIEADALLESDPDATRIVAAPIEGRIVALDVHLGERVTRGQRLALIESRAAATLQGDVERARSQAKLANATLARDEALHAKGWRALREVEISRAAAEQADTALRMARQQLAASGVQGGSLNRIAIVAPIAGQVIARGALAGQTFNAENAGGELFRIADLDRLTVIFSLPPADAARMRPGAPLEISADARRQPGRIRFISPVLDADSRLVRVIAEIDNRAGIWRAGEPVRAHVPVDGAGGGGALTIPASAVQMIADRSVVFVRTRDGFRAMPVTLGARDGDEIAVMRGLTGGETIAAANSFILKAELGQRDSGGDAAHGEH